MKKVGILLVLITHNYLSIDTVSCIRRLDPASTALRILKPYNAKGILAFLFMAYLTPVSVAHIE